MTKELGLSPLDEEFIRQHFRALIKEKIGNVKNSLVNPRNLAGIGNVYVQDILFEAEIHPNRKLDSLTAQEDDALHDSIKNVLSRNLKKKKSGSPSSIRI